METTDDHILETVALDLCPVLNLVAWNILGIAGDIIACEGVCTVCAYGCHKLIIFIRNEILCSQLRHRVNLVIFLLAESGILDKTIFFVTLGDVVEERLLSFWIVSAELLCSLEHKVLKVVSQTCCLGRIVFGTSTHSDISLDAWLFLVYR